MWYSICFVVVIISPLTYEFSSSLWNYNAHRSILWSSLGWIDFFLMRFTFHLLSKTTLSLWKWCHWMAFPYEVKGISNARINLGSKMACTLSINLQRICYAEAWENADLLRMTWPLCCFWPDYWSYLLSTIITVCFLCRTSFCYLKPNKEKLTLADNIKLLYYLSILMKMLFCERYWQLSL